MKKTKTEQGYTLENNYFLIDVSYKYTFGKKESSYYVENKNTGKFYFPKTLREAREICES